MTDTPKHSLSSSGSEPNGSGPGSDAHWADAYTDAEHDRALARLLADMEDTKMMSSTRDISRVIFRYPITVDCANGRFGEFAVDLPANCIVRHAGLSVDGVPSIWVEVWGDTAPATTRTFWLAGTGKEIPARFMEHLGSFNIMAYTWHLYQ